MTKPFKVANPALKNTNETRPVVAPYSGKAIIHSQQTGDPLPPAGADSVDHPPEIKWPPAGGLDDAHKPFKNTK
jgi:hypothetical protein